MQNKLKILILSVSAIFIILLAFNCKKGASKNEINNNKSEIIKTLIDSALYKNRLPNSNYMKGQFPFGDTLIFKQNALLKNLPNELEYKILTEEELCEATALYRDKKNGFQYFLELKILEKKDLFDATLESHCLYYNQDNQLCEQEKYCNGVMNMEFRKSNNKLIIGNPFFISY